MTILNGRPRLERYCWEASRCIDGCSPDVLRPVDLIPPVLSMDSTPSTGMGHFEVHGSRSNASVAVGRAEALGSILSRLPLHVHHVHTPAAT
jgi:hypothetical protein